jgi:hypothetical protein
MKRQDHIVVSPPRAIWKRALSAVVVVLSIAWTCFLVRAAWGDLAKDFGRLHIPSLTAGLAFSLVSTLLGFAAFLRLFREINGRGIDRLEIAHLYFVGQLMRHLPGRFFGFAYQIAHTRGRISSARWIAVNGVYMLLSAGLAIATALSVLLGLRSLPGGMAVFAMCIGAIFILWMPTTLQVLSSFASRGPSSIAQKAASLAKAMAQIEMPSRVAIVAELCMSWLIYFIAWGCYGRAYPGLSIGDGITMCALYSIAWLAGYLAFVTPSGLGVREIAFTALSRGFAPGATAYGIVIGRLSLLATDIILGLAFLARRKKADPV